MAASQIDVPELETYEWASKGEEPSSPVESVYEPLKEPKAQHDNDYQTKIYNDLRNHRQVLVELRDRLGDLEGDVTTLREDHNSLEDAFRKHNHDSRYPRQYDVYYREEADKTFAPRKHNHDDRYWRKHLAEDRYLNSTPEGDRGEGRISLPELEMRVGEGFEIVGDGDYWGRNNDARVFRAKDNNADGGFLWEFTDPNGENRQEMLAIRAPDKHDSITHGGATVWHADNDGHTSGLNADKLDGTHLQTLYNDLVDADGDLMTGELRLDYINGDVMRIGDSGNHNGDKNVIRYDDIPLGFYAGSGQGHTFELGHDRVITRELLEVKDDIFMNNGVVKNTNRVDSVNGAISFLEYDGNTRITPGDSKDDAVTLSNGIENSRDDIVTVPNTGPVQIERSVEIRNDGAEYLQLPRRRYGHLPQHSLYVQPDNRNLVFYTGNDYITLASW